MLKEYHLKLMRVEPLVHYTVDTVVGMDVLRELKNMKVYFQDWKNTTTIMEVNESEIETLIDNLKQYSNEQVQESQTGEDQGGTPSNEDD
jgi:hypothetical protein